MSVVVTGKSSTDEIIASIGNEWSEAATADLRKEALVNFQRLGLPANKAEEYKYTPLTRALEKNFSFATSNAASKGGINVNALSIPGLTGNVLVFINGIFSREQSSIVSPASEITILTLEEALAQKPELVLPHLGKIASHTADPFVAWNTAAWKEGVFIHVPANKIIEQPILIHHIHDVQDGQVMTASRNLVLIEKNSEVTVLEKYDSLGAGNGFSSVVTEGVVAENAGLYWYTIQNDSGNRYQFECKQFNQSNASRVNTYTFTLNGKLVRNNLQLSLDGEGIDSHMYGLYVLGKDTLADNHTVVDHKQPNSFSNELYKGIMEENGKGVFNGKIYVRPNAQKTNAFQANRNILLTDKATVNTKPQLEIWADDVKCSHGCTTGQLDEEAVFYLQARGISKETARAMMLYAFAGEVFDKIKHPAIKAYVDDLISERLHKNF